MKHLRRVLSILSFLFMYIAPIVLFGGVVPYTREAMAAGLTVAGYFAAAIIALVLLGKLTDRIKQIKRATLRDCLLSIKPIAVWIIIFAGNGKVADLIGKISTYWIEVGIFLGIGILCRIFAAVISDKEESEASDA